MSRLVGTIFALGGTLLAIRSLRLAHVREFAVQTIDSRDLPAVTLSWRYSEGIRPLSLIIDLCGAGDFAGSLTASGQILMGELPLAAALQGKYEATLTLTYRQLGLVRVVRQICTGEVG
jgi:hypothetical protein